MYIEHSCYDCKWQDNDKPLEPKRCYECCWGEEQFEPKEDKSDEDKSDEEKK